MSHMICYTCISFLWMRIVRCCVDGSGCWWLMLLSENVINRKPMGSINLQGHWTNERWVRMNEWLGMTFLGSFNEPIDNRWVRFQGFINRQIETEFLVAQYRNRISCRIWLYHKNFQKCLDWHIFTVRFLPDLYSICHIPSYLGLFTPIIYHLTFVLPIFWLII